MDDPVDDRAEHVCRTCHHYRREPFSADRVLGVCTHPAHASTGVRVLIYPHETRCYRGIGQDDWAPAGQTGVDRLIDERPVPLHRRRRHLGADLPFIPLHLDLTDHVAD